MTLTLAKTTRLLLVDDDPNMVRLLSRIIERQVEGDIDLMCMSDPTEARTQIADQLFDILITDLEMPGVNGLELLRCAKRRNPCTQVLFITGHSTLGSLTHALELGATDYLLKPLDRVKLIQLIRDAQERVLRWREALAGTLNPTR